MKRPLALIGTTLAAAASLAAPGDGPSDAVPIVPVPPAFDEAGDVPTHRPHPSYRQLSSGGLPTTTEGRHSASEQRPKGERRRLSHATTGQFHNLVLLLRFADHAARPLPSQSDIHHLYNSEEFDLASLNVGGSNYGGVNVGGLSPAQDVAPTGSVRQVYHSNSHGIFTINTTVVDWIDLPNTEAYYANGNHGFTKFKEAIASALITLDSYSSAERGFEFSDFDLDENGALDGFGVLHSGHGAEFAGDDCHGAVNEHRIWSHKGGLDWTSSPDVDGDAVRANRYYVSSSLRGKCHSKIVRMGVICHELGHYLGLPDWYDSTFDGTGLGAYDFMSQSWGWDGSGLYPPNLSAWSKVEVGWATSQLIEYDGEYELDSEQGDVFKITYGFPNGEYLLLENRQPVGYDSKLAQGGIAVYHVDENANGQKERGYPNMDSDGGPWPQNGEHYKVALLGSDGSYHLEKGTNQGDAGDLWHASSTMSELKPGAAAFPNTDTYQNGVVTETGIRIYGFSESGTVMAFYVDGLGAPEVADGDAASNGGVHDVEAMFAPKNEASAVTPKPTSAPTPVPTKLPTSEPSNEPTKQPTKAPVTPNPTSPPTASPITQAQACSDVCTEPIPATDCPLDASALPNCLEVQMGALCDGDGECGTNQFLNNCVPHDVYRRVECVASAALESAAFAPAVLPVPQETAEVASVTDPTQPVIATLPVPQEGDFPLDGRWETPGGPDDLEIYVQPEPEPGANMVTLTADPTSSPSQAPSAAPTKKPAALQLSGGGSFASKPLVGGRVAGSDSNEAEADEDTCPYYPGWNVGRSHCLNDCHQPSYMHGKSIFEFASLDECCYLHFQGRTSCTVQSLMEERKRRSALPSISGRVWEDTNGNDWQDWTERTMGGGVPGVVLDLYECTGQRVQTVRSVADGAYLFPDVPPGRYFVQITPKEGYHLSKDREGRDHEYDSDFAPAAWGLGRSECLEVGGEDVSLDAGLIPDEGDGGGSRFSIRTERVSAAEASEKEPQTGMSASQSVVHSKSRTSNSQEVSASEPASQSTPIHSKSGLRGSVSTSFQSINNYETSDASMVAVNPAADATIHSDESIRFTGGTDELRVGPNQHWQDDVLLKFDMSPSHQTATKAVLRLYSLSSSPAGGVVHACTSSSWDEGAVTWSSAPEAGEELATIGLVRPNSWMEVDVTGMLATVEDSVASLRITSEEGNHSWVAKYASRENGEHPAPELRVYF